MHATDTGEQCTDSALERPPREQAMVFACGDDNLVGILATPETPRRRGVIVIVGGPQYRAGSHRQFTLLARRLAGAGYPTFRFDYRGMGDSTGTPRDFDSIDVDIRAAIRTFRESAPGVEEIVLWALCDGAAATMMFAERDEGVAGMVILNPWVSTTTTRARAHVRFYYPRRVLQREFWTKLASGKLRAGAVLSTLASNLRQARSTGAPHADFMTRMRQGLARFSGPTLLVLSGNDLVARELPELAAMDPGWRDALADPRVRQVVIPDADHTFSRRPWTRAVEEHTVDWLGSW